MLKRPKIVSHLRVSEKGENKLTMSVPNVEQVSTPKRQSRIIYNITFIKILSIIGIQNFSKSSALSAIRNKSLLKLRVLESFFFQKKRGLMILIPIANLLQLF